MCVHGLLFCCSWFVCPVVFRGAELEPEPAALLPTPVSIRRVAIAVLSWLFVLKMVELEKWQTCCLQEH